MSAISIEARSVFRWQDTLSTLHFLHLTIACSVRISHSSDTDHGHGIYDSFPIFLHKRDAKVLVQRLHPVIICLEDDMHNFLSSPPPLEVIMIDRDRAVDFTFECPLDGRSGKIVGLDLPARSEPRSNNFVREKRMPGRTRRKIHRLDILRRELKICETVHGRPIGVLVVSILVYPDFLIRIKILWYVLVQQPHIGGSDLRFYDAVLQPHRSRWTLPAESAIQKVPFTADANYIHHVGPASISVHFVDARAGHVDIKAKIVEHEMIEVIDLHAIASSAWLANYLVVQ